MQAMIFSYFFICFDLSIVTKVIFHVTVQSWKWRCKRKAARLQEDILQ